MQILIDLVSSIRNIRAQWNIKLQEKLSCHLACPQEKTIQILRMNENILKNLAKLDTIYLEKEINLTKNIATALVGQIQCAIPLKGLIDIDKEKGKLSLDLETQKKAIHVLTGRLSNESFTAKAPADVIAKDKERLELLKLKIQELEKMIATLN
jgi:valyl-tRNA synthetase